MKSVSTGDYMFTFNNNGICENRNTILFKRVVIYFS